MAHHATLARAIANGAGDDPLTRLLVSAADRGEIDLVDAIGVHRAVRHVIAHRDQDNVQIAVGSAYIDELEKLVASPEHTRPDWLYNKSARV